MLKAIFATATLLVSINLRADDKAAVGLPYLPIVDSTDEIFAPTQQVPLLPLAVDTVSDAVSSFPVPSAPLTDDSPEPDEAIPEIDFAAMNTPELFQVYSPAMSGDGCGESCFCPVAADGDRSVTVYGGLLFLGRSRPDSQALFSNQTNPAQQWHLLSWRKDLVGRVHDGQVGQANSRLVVGSQINADQQRGCSENGFEHLSSLIVPIAGRRTSRAFANT